jgi:hypothetical protein
MQNLTKHMSSGPTRLGFNAFLFIVHFSWDFFGQPECSDLRPARVTDALSIHMHPRPQTHLYGKAQPADT